MVQADCTPGRSKAVAPANAPAAKAPLVPFAETSDPHVDTEIAMLFKAIDAAATGLVSPKTVISELARQGLGKADPRLQHLFQALGSRERFDVNAFAAAINGDSTLLSRALRGDLVIPEFSHFCDGIRAIYDEVKGNNGGKVADYIPQLKRVPAEKFGISICTIDGQRFNIGDAQEHFSIQSTCKPLNYCLALEENGEQKVHEHLGREPSGHSFNEITLDARRRPHNPLINAGAIMAASLIKNHEDAASRFDYVLENWSRICGGIKPGFDNAVYLSEKATADRNFALAYFMRENGAFPAGVDLQQTLEFYFQCCSITQTAEGMATAAATLAQSGICPLTGDNVFRPEVVKHCLSLMYSCGMYDFSGEFAFTIGLPAKSGVGGGLMVVVPHVMGMCIWSPPLDAMGNSVRGIEVCKKLVAKYNFHNYDSLNTDHSQKTDPRVRKTETKLNGVMSLCWAAAHGDINEIQRLIAGGTDLDEADYDGRTALHLAASEGHLEVVKFLLNHGVQPSPIDRWGGAPLDDAKRGQHTNVAALLARHHKGAH